MSDAKKEHEGSPWIEGIDRRLEVLSEDYVVVVGFVSTCALHYWKALHPMLARFPFSAQCPHSSKQMGGGCTHFHIFLRQG